MIKNYFLVPLFLLGVVLTINAQIVNIPDINFKTALINNSSVNTNGDDEIQVSEAESFNQPLAIYDRNISDLTGLESFINITYLDCSDNPINNINISNNSKLVALYCNSTNITDIDLTQNIELEYIQISGNAITTIDITKNTKLLSFTCQDSQINSIDFSNNIELNFLNLSGNSLNNIDLSKNTKLDVINLNSNLISQINVSNNTLLEDLFIDSNQLTQIDISNNLNLKNLHIDKNKLTSLNTSHNVNLTGLNAEFNEINSIDLNNNINLITLKLSYNNLPTLDLTKNTQLKTLRCGKNNLTSLDLSQNVELIALYLFSSGINDLDLQFNTKLKILDTQHSKINSINLLKNTLLERITMSRFNGSSIDFSKNTSLQRVYFNSSPNINDLDFSNNPNLTQLYLSGNDNITRINIANNNNNIISNFNAKNNSNLTCIQIDSGFTPPSTWYKDTTSSYSDNCTQYKLSLANSTNGNIDVTPNRSTLVYEQNMDVILTATPDAGYQFDGWSGDTTGNTNPLTITMDTDKTVTALFSKIQHTLTTNATNGSISRNPDTPTSGTYDIGTDVILTATPDAGYQFDGWSGDATGNTNPLTITMDTDKTVTALFSKIQHTLTTNATNGSISRNPDTTTSGTYDIGTDVFLTATPDAGYQFDGWSGDATGNTNPLTITMDTDKTVTALFSKIQHTLTTNATNGSISRNPDTPTSGTYDIGTDVILTATPDAGYQFDGWSGDATGNTNPLTITMDADKTITAIFSEIPSTIEVSTFASGFTSLEGIAINSNNEVFVSEHDSGKIYSIDTNGNSTEFASSGFRLNDIVFNKEDKLFAAQVSNDDILISDNSGNLSEYIDAFGKSPYGLTFYDDKLYYTSDFGNVYNIDINKNETTYINGFLSAAGIDFDSKGNAYIADKNDRKLYKVDNNGTKTEIVNGTAKIIGVKVVNDIVYFTSSKLNSDKIVKYNPETNTTEDYVTTSLDDPRNLDVDYIGNMYITNGGNGTVVKVHDENLKQATASINDEAFNNQLTIFPNPVKNNLTIKSNNHSIIKNVVILDLLGKEIIKTQELNINISNLPNGVYLLKIKGENNKIAIKKFIKQ